MADDKKDSRLSVSSGPRGSADVGTGTILPASKFDDDVRGSRAPALEHEVFGDPGEGQVDFRTVGWVRAAMFLLKQTFATGVLSIPSAMYYLGAVAGCLFILLWSAVNTYMAHIQGQYKLAHPRMHTVIDAAEIATLDLTGGRKGWARVAKGIAEALYIVSWLLCIGLSVLAIGTALNAVSGHAACTVAFNVVAFVVCTATGSIRKIHGLGILLWIGFVSAVASILIVVIAVAVRDRPAAAPQEGDFDLGFSAGPPPGTTFTQAWAASIAIYASSANTCGYVPVMSEMRRPADYFKSLYVSGSWIAASYLALATTVYAYCGKWVTSPSLGSAGDRIKVVSYAVALPGLVATGMITVHVVAKSLFVRVLRNSKHLTANTVTHWGVWMGCTTTCGFLGWLLAEAIPFFTSLVSLIGSLGFGPLGMCLPPVLWFSLNKEKRRGTVRERATWWFHVAILVMGLFLSIGGTYANISNIVDQFRAGKVGSAFSCADNSATVVGS